MRVVLRGLVLLWLVGCASAAVAALPDPIRLDAGRVSGVAGKAPTVRVFKGIPYAAPPVGELRWRAPQPVAPWQGVRKADEFGPICMQAAAPGATARMSEDCLYLNVFTAAQRAGERRPVMVWLHPGGYNTGAGSQPGYDGEQFAQQGVVIVTINYRLGALGFFSHPQLTQEGKGRWAANQAFLDQIAALRWVQRNIAAFGGDARNVTVFGNSAGGTSISNLVASPLARGLFARAISQSGAWLGLSIAPVRTLADAQTQGEMAAQALQVNSLEALRQVPAAELIKVARPAGPVIDGYFYPQDPALIYAQGRQNKVAIIAGSNKDEGTFFLQPTTVNDWATKAVQRFGLEASAFLDLYPANNDEAATQSQFDAFRDELAWVDRNYVRLQTKAGAKAWLYYFTHEPPGPPLWPARGSGATHGGEAQFIWNNLIADRPWRDVDRQVAQTVQRYWINFATRGDPNGPGLPRWDAYDEQRAPQAQQLAAQPGPAPLPDAAKLAFFQRWYDRMAVAHGPAPTVASIERLMALDGSKAMIEQYVQRAVSAIQIDANAVSREKSLTPRQQQALADIVAKHSATMRSEMTLEKLKPIFVKVYVDSLDQAEVDGMIAFYQTAAGQALLKKMPNIRLNTLLVLSLRMRPLEPSFESLSREVEQAGAAPAGAGASSPQR